MTLTSVVLAALAVFLGTYLFRNSQTKRLAYSNGCQPPRSFPHKDPLFGLDAFFETSRMFTDNEFFQITLKRFAEYGRTFEMNSFGIRTVHSIEPRNIDSVFSSDSENWGVAPIRLPPMGPYFGRGFLTVDGAEWQRSRSYFSHSFQRTNVFDHKTFNRYLTFMIDKIPRDGSIVDLQELALALYTDTSTLFVFGESFESLSRGLSEESQGFVQTLHKSFEGTGIRQGLGPLMFLYQDPAWKKANAQNHEFVQRYADKAAARSRAAGHSNQLDGRRGKLFLEAMAEDVKDPIQLRNQAIHAFTAANETTACLVSNVMWNLARHPTVWSRLRAEVATLGNAELDYDKPMRLPYLQHVINETHRLFPVFPFHCREALKNCSLPRGGGPTGEAPVYIRAGDRFEASFLTLNRDPSVWGSDAGTWRPDRWQHFQPTAWQFVPFGLGPRACLGKQKASMEAAFYVCRMLREFKSIEARDDRGWIGQVTVTAKNVHGVKVALTPA